MAVTLVNVYMCVWWVHRGRGDDATAFQEATANGGGSFDGVGGVCQSIRWEAEPEIE